MKLPELSHRLSVVSEKIAHYENDLKRVGRGREIVEPEIRFYVNGVEYTIDSTRINFGNPKLEINLIKVKMNQQLEHAINTFIACLGDAMNPETREFAEIYLRICEVETTEFSAENIIRLIVIFGTEDKRLMRWAVRINYESMTAMPIMLLNVDGGITFDQIRAANEVLCDAVSMTLNAFKNE